MARRKKAPGLLSRKALRERRSNTFFKKWFGTVNKVPNPPKDRELTEYQPKKGTRLPSFIRTEIDKLIEGAPPGTFTSEPESIVAGWLTKNDVPFSSQEQFGGGRLPGGTVVDFVITIRPSNPIGIRVQSYWHNTPEARFFDEVQKAEIEATGTRVFDLWEDDIRQSDVLDRKMWGIIHGIQI